MSELFPTVDPNVPIAPEPARPHTRETNPLRWARHNLFRSPVDGVVTVISAVVVGYVLFRLVRFVFVTARWDIVRVNLRLFMFGRYPADDLWRLVVVSLGAAFLVGLAVGAGIQSRRRELGAPPHRPWARVASDVFSRTWPLLVGVVVLLAMTTTVLPTVAVIATAAAGWAGRVFADRVPDRFVVWSLIGATAVATTLVWMPNGAAKYVVAAAIAAVVIAAAVMITAPPAPAIVLVLGGGLAAMLVAVTSGWLRIVIAVIAVTAVVVALIRVRTVPMSVPFWLTIAGALLAVSSVRLLTRPTDGWDAWGGLMLNVFLAVAGIALCFPLGVLLALGRRAGRTGGSTVGGILAGVVLGAPFLVIALLRGFDPGALFSWVLVVIAAGLGVGGFVSGRRTSLPLLRAVSVGYIELVRGMPLYVLLLISFASLVFFFPAGARPPGLVVRAIVVITLFTAAYIAEIVRGGLQSLPRGQTEAAAALGLSPLKTTGLIVLPQALRNVIPAIVGQFISLLKDTTLVGAAMGTAEIFNVREAAMAQTAFQGQRLIPETIMFVSFVFWVICITMSRESQRLEQKLGVGSR